jgi:hypothetical protein
MNRRRVGEDRGSKETDRCPLTVELAMSYSGVNLASAFTHILQEFGISEKVSIYESILERNLPRIFSFSASLATTHPPMIQ